MVHMLGFYDEDKQRICLISKEQVQVLFRAVLGFPGRLVCGSLGGGSAEVPSKISSENQEMFEEE
ncbi:unnamed protein product [Ilex paraguariensis]|uniref:Uncharacterized protein n=1 Tax=Ilex paraguariensis TaxID=185542 RepID=A0ABC8QY19_9AQUA